MLSISINGWTMFLHEMGNAPQLMTIKEPKLASIVHCTMQAVVHGCYLVPTCKAKQRGLNLADIIGVVPFKAQRDGIKMDEYGGKARIPQWTCNDLDVENELNDQREVVEFLGCIPIFIGWHCV